MDRIRSMQFPPDMASIDDMVDSLRAIRGVGADVKVDGWSAVITGASKLRPDAIQEIKDHREAFIYHFIVECPHPCESCWGVGVRQDEHGAWFCTGHYPDSPAKDALHRLAQGMTRMSEQITEYRNRPNFDEATYKKMLVDHQQRGEVLAQMWKEIEPHYPSTL